MNSMSFLQYRPTKFSLVLSVIYCLVSCFAWTSSSASADDQLRKVQRAYIDTIKPLLKVHCADCHSGDAAEAGFNLEKYDQLDQLLNARKKWKKVLNRVAAKEMPPEDYDPIPDSDHTAIMKWLDQLLNSVDCTTINPGRVTIRRLNRVEYRNSIRDLLGVDFEPADDFPGDDVGYGFDNIADVLSLPPILMEEYLNAAEKITDELIEDPENPAYQKTADGSQFKATDQSRIDDLSHVMIANCTIKHTFKKIPRNGEYQFTIRAWGTPAKNAGPEMVVAVNGKKIGKRSVDAGQNEPAEFVFNTKLRKGDRTIEIAFTNDLYVPKKEDRNLIINSVRLSGPIDPSPQQLKLIPPVEGGRSKENKAARKTINSIASRAYRRRATSDELDRFMGLYEQQREEGENHAMALKYTFQAVLVSPYFLYKVENPTAPGKKRMLTDFELATALSYFLWSSMPDDELLKVAGQGKLKSFPVYKSQIKRMLADPKSEALVENFVGQWLQLGHLEHIKPDPDLFPGVDDQLRKDMATETKLLIADLIKRDASVFDLLDTKYTFINHRLAKHYGAKTIRGEKFLKVDSTKYGRSGLMTHASILTLTSNPNRTSPVKRGKWIMENLLGEEPPPPDPDAMQLEDQQELTGTLRQRMEQHRANPNCAVCHQVMDELGFALENYDAVGKWRDRDQANAIDARGELPDGTVFEGADQLQQTLKNKMREQFVRCLTEKMLIYALGRGLEYFDECTVDKIMEKLKQNDYKFSTLIAAVVTSDPFIKREGAPNN
jgi:mono/diheme cytochrome c family protein